MIAYFPPVNHQLVWPDPAKSKYEKQKSLFRKNMTCIICGKCKDGVVLVADRKIICSTNSVETRDKIFMDFTPFVVASSGYTTSFDNFRREAKDLAVRSRGFRVPGQQVFATVPYDPTAFSGVATYTSSSLWPHPTIPRANYLDGLRSIVKRYKTEVNSDPTYEFDVVVATRAEDTGSAYLSYIIEIITIMTRFVSLCML